MKTIHATQGLWLTQANLANGEERVFFRTITTATPNAWREVDNTFKEQWEAEHQPEELEA